MNQGMAKERDSVRVNLREYGHTFGESYTARLAVAQDVYRARELADAQCHVELSAAEVVTTAATSTERRECCLMAKIEIRGQLRYKDNR
jgi:hypothetical protein